MNRVEELLRSMTWDEKLAQMQVLFRPDPAELDPWVRAGVGATFGFGDTDANPARFTVEPGTFALYVGSTLHASSELTLDVV